MSPITKILIGALATLSAVQALPQQEYKPSTTTTTVVPTATANSTAPANDALIAQLMTLPTAIKRFQKLLTSAGERLLSPEEVRKQTVFNFNGAPRAPKAKGGATKAANIDSMPILTGLGISTTVGFLNGCGMNSPHVHPRATEFLTVTKGQLEFGYILENGLVKQGSAEVSGKLGEYEGTVFPMGSIHYQFNPTCEPAIFVASLNSEDPGTSQVAQNFFGLNGNVVNATLGFPKTLDGRDIEQFKSQIPANIAQAIQSCVASCPPEKLNGPF